MHAAREAVEQVAKPKRGDRKSARAQNAKSLVRFNSKNYADALTEFAQAARTDPRDQEIRNNLGQALLELARFAEAEERQRGVAFFEYWR